MKNSDMKCEKRRLPRFNLMAGVKETALATLAYSEVSLHSTGKTIVAIGMNPRGDGPITTDNDDTNGTNLESTRRTEIYRFTDKCSFEDLKELVQLDLFSCRTQHSNELHAKIKSATADELDDIIGKDNLKTIKCKVNSADLVLLAWGSGVQWDKLREYGNEISEILIDNADKVYWFGSNRDGSPMHPASRKKRELSKMSNEDIDNVFGR